MKTNITFIIICSILFSCSTENFTPKPSGYIRLDVPEATYQKYDTTCPYQFEYSKHATIQPFHRSNENIPCWFDIHYSKFKATIHCSYDPVNGNLKQYIDDAYALVYKHAVKSSGIQESMIIDTSYHIFGTLYNLEGDPATPYQFYLTDSSNHFFRAALYFDYKPNYDSLQPILDFLKKDMDHMISTFQWKR